jgi:tRNA U34 5-carboxymethylaminomethyl modifying GTPase MnmE/TrmE
MPSWTLATASRPSAIGVIHISGDDLDRALASLHIRDVGVGQVALRSLAGVDEGVVLRTSVSSCLLMPHGGRAVIEALIARMERAGFSNEPEPDPRVAYPEAADPVEAWMLHVLSRAASPMAVDLLLRQPALWSMTPGPVDERGLPRGEVTPTDMRLGRLLSPPLVVAVGPANIGKSTLCNALAGRTVSIVADEPGTTRDHVGVLLDLSGLAVRYVDTPGVRTHAGPMPGASPIEEAAARLAREVVNHADLVLSCCDPTVEPLPDPPVPPDGALRGNRLLVCLRADRGVEGWKSEVRVSTRTGEGLDVLPSMIRARLVPDADLNSGARWRFWSSFA